MKAIGNTNLRRRIAVLDTVSRSREHARRAIRGLGHAPFLFANVEELRELGRRARGFAMVFLGAPSDEAEFGAVVAELRSLVGLDVPILFGIVEDKLHTAISHCQARDDVIATPSSFCKLHQSMERLMRRQCLPIYKSHFEWGRYRFLPATGTVQMEGSCVELQPLDFDLALELFHNVDRTLSRHWLRSMSVGCEGIRASRWLDHSMWRVRRALDLSPEHGWSLNAVPRQGYRLSKTDPAAVEDLLASEALDLQRY